MAKNAVIYSQETQKLKVMNIIFLAAIAALSGGVQYLSSSTTIEQNKYHFIAFFVLCFMLIYFQSSFDTAFILGLGLLMTRVMIVYFRQAVCLFVRTSKGDRFWFNLFCIEQVAHCFIFSSIFFTLF